MKYTKRRAIHQRRKRWNKQIQQIEENEEKDEDILIKQINT